MTTAGWTLIPTWVGRQPSCGDGDYKISTNDTTAGSQGVTEADDAVYTALTLDIGSGAIIYNDIEGANGWTSCPGDDDNVLAYLNGWDSEIHRLGFLSGYYSSASYNMAAASTVSNVPDDIWFADYNTNTGTFGDPYISDSLWSGKRIHHLTVRTMQRLAEWSCRSTPTASTAKRPERRCPRSRAPISNQAVRGNGNNVF
jgi:hypothetical protein